MQTKLADFIKQTAKGRVADRILRNCVHCGFCNAVCPTYQVLGDELDGPRGRIYLIKQLLEGNQATRNTQMHLDRCLTCRACESACPSGVQYVRLLDIGRELMEQQVKRPWFQLGLRKLLLHILPYSRRFSMLSALGWRFRFLLPRNLSAKLPKPVRTKTRPVARHQRRMLMLEGCVQPAMAPNINFATIEILDRLGIGVVPVPNAGCCGALPFHLNEQTRGLDMMRNLVDAWWPHVQSGIEAIVINASGCGVTVKEFGDLLAHDPAYAEKASRISALAKDVAEIVAQEDLSAIPIKPRRIAFHAPCTLQHGQKINGLVETLLTQLGFTLTPVADAHLCCGSAGTYSILQPALAGKLRSAKLESLQAARPELIATANVGCLLYLREQASVPVMHWIELLLEEGFV